jgi:N12 class adenine-specific DNA methylase
MNPNDPFEASVTRGSLAGVGMPIEATPPPVAAPVDPFEAAEMRWVAARPAVAGDLKRQREELMRPSGSLKNADGTYGAPSMPAPPPWWGLTPKTGLTATKVTKEDVDSKMYGYTADDIGAPAERDSAGVIRRKYNPITGAWAEWGDKGGYGWHEDNAIGYRPDLDPREKVGFFGELTDVGKAFSATSLGSAIALRGGQPTPEEAAYQAFNAPPQTGPGKVAAIVRDSAAFATDFVLTGSAQRALSTPARAAARSFAEKVLGAGGQLGKVGRLTEAAAEMGARGIAVAPTGIPAGIKDAVEIAAVSDAPFMESLYKGMGGQFIERFSEFSGGVVARGAGMLVPEKLRLLKAAIAQKWMSKSPGVRTISNFAEQVAKVGGWDGILGEIGEEYVGGVMKDLAQIEDFRGFSNEEIMQMAAAFAIPGGVVKTAQGGMAATDAVRAFMQRRAQAQGADAAVTGEPVLQTPPGTDAPLQAAPVEQQAPEVVAEVSPVPAAEVMPHPTATQTAPVPAQQAAPVQADPIAEQAAPAKSKHRPGDRVIVNTEDGPVQATVRFDPKAAPNAVTVKTDAGEIITASLDDVEGWASTKIDEAEAVGVAENMQADAATGEQVVASGGNVMKVDTSTGDATPVADVEIRAAKEKKAKNKRPYQTVDVPITPERAAVIRQVKEAVGNREKIQAVLGDKTDAYFKRMAGGEQSANAVIRVMGWDNEAGAPAPTAQSAPATFKEGDRVQKIVNGKTLTGTVQGVDSVNGDLTVKVDQILKAGGVPIGRIEYWPNREVQSADASSKDVGGKASTSDSAPSPTTANQPTAVPPAAPKRSRFLKNLTPEEMASFDDAKARFTKAAGGSTLSAGLNTDALTAAVQMGYLVAKSGIRSFQKWAAVMHEELGDVGKTYLREAWAAVRANRDMRTYAKSGEMVDSETVADMADEELDRLIIQGRGELENDDASQPNDAVADAGASGAGVRERGPTEQAEPRESGDDAGGRSGGNVGGAGASGDDARTGAGAGDGNADRRDREAGKSRRGRRAAAGDERDGGGDARETPAQEQRQHDAKALDTADHVIENPDTLAMGSPKAKYAANMKALETYRRIQAEGRTHATPEEKRILSQWVGWGMFPQVFNRDSAWSVEAEALAQALSRDEMYEARNSTKNAHYTSAPMVQAMYDMVRRLGFEAGRVLEPSMGIGNFFGLMPADMAAKSKRVGIELEPITGGMAKLIYPASVVRVAGFQDVRLPPDFFDLVIGNVPFSSTTIYDPEYKSLTLNTHDYFIVRSLDKVRQGGLVALITSTGTLDKAGAQGSRAREAMANRASLVAAFRLPGGAFEANAGTQVVTDLLIFQKHTWVNGARKENPHAQAFQEVVTVPDPDGGEPIPVNEYFKAHPEHIIGRLDRTGTMYRAGSKNVSVTGDWREMLAEQVKKLPAGIAAKEAQPDVDVEGAMVEDRAGKEGGLSVDDGKLFRRVNGAMVRVQADKPTIDRVKALLTVRDAARELVQAEARDADVAVLDDLRQKLNRAYDRATSKHGKLRSRPMLRAIADDPDAMFVASLETDTMEKAAIFTKRTIRGTKIPESVGSAVDAMVVSLNEKGSVDIPFMVGLTKTTAAKVEEELRASGQAFEDPSEGWQSRERYLSGNVRAKLVQAEAAAAIDERYMRNVEALKAVQPPDKTADQIDVQLGSAWVPPDTYAEFYAGALGGSPDHVMVSFKPSTGSFLFQFTPRGERLARSQTAKLLSTDRVEFAKIAEAGMNRQTIKVFDKMADGSSVLNTIATGEAAGKVQELREKFTDWVWNDDTRRQRLTRIYNDQFNSVAPPSADGSNLTLPGMSPEVTLRDHQKNAVRRIINERRAGLFHEVGTGKTYTMIAAAMEVRRLGIAKKPTITCLLSTAPDFVRDIYHLYPGARLLNVAAATDADSRRRLIAQAATGDYDLILMTHEQIGGITCSPETEVEYIQDQIEEAEAAIEQARQADRAAGLSKSSDSRFVKQLAKRLDQLRERGRELLDKKAIKADDQIYFEDTGIDFLFIDEAQAFKNLPVQSALNVKGIARSDTGRAADMMMKIRHIGKLQKGRGVVPATGTPISNTIGETFVMMKMMAEADLHARNIGAFDAWVSTFGHISDQVEYTIDLRQAPTQRLRDFVNIGELQTLFRDTADVVFADDIGLKRPKKVNYVETIEMTPDQEDYREQLRALAAEIRARRGPPKKGDLPITIVGQRGAASSIDMRLVDPTADAESGSKIPYLVANIRKYLDAHPGTTQMIFTEVRTLESLNPAFNLVDEIVNQLEKAGVPRDKIIDFSNLTKTERRDAARRLNNGDAWIGIGSTKTLGTGVNAQKNLIALHHLDVTYTPAEMEQREGRGYRQGNMNPTGEINIHRYVTTGSFDVFRWGIVDRKYRFIQRFMRGQSVAGTMREEDGEDLTPEQVAAMATGDPKQLELLNVAYEVEKLETQRRRAAMDAARVRDSIGSLEKTITHLESQLAATEAERVELAEFTAKPFEVKIGSTLATTSEQVYAAVNAAFPLANYTDTGKEIGSMHGLRVRLGLVASGDVVNLTIDGPKGVGYSVSLRTTSVEMNDGKMVKTVHPNMQASLRAVMGTAALERAVETTKATLESARADLAKAKTMVSSGFKRDAELEEKRARREVLRKEVEANQAADDARRAEQKQARDLLWSMDDAEFAKLASERGVMQEKTTRNVGRLLRAIGQSEVIRMFADQIAKAKAAQEFKEATDPTKLSAGLNADAAIAAAKFAFYWAKPHVRRAAAMAYAAGKALVNIPRAAKLMMLSLTGKIRNEDGSVAVDLAGMYGDAAGKALPRITAMDAASSEAGVRYVSAPDAAVLQGDVYADSVIGDHTPEDVELAGAVLTEDNLRSVRKQHEAMAAEYTARGEQEAADAAAESAKAVYSLVGDGRYFETEEEYQAALRHPGVVDIINRFIDSFSPVMDELYKKASGIPLDDDLPSRGEQTGCRINLKANRPEQTAKPIGMANDQTRPFVRKSSFNRRATGAASLGYDIDLREIIKNSVVKQLEIATQREWYATMEAAGIAKIAPMGSEVMLRGVVVPPGSAVDIQYRTLVISKNGEAKVIPQNNRLYLHPAIAGEVKAALRKQIVDVRGAKSVLVGAIEAANMAALVGPADATTHAMNVATVLFTRPGVGRGPMGRTLHMLGGVPAILAALDQLLAKGMKHWFGNRETKQRHAYLVSIGAMRVEAHDNPSEREGLWAKVLDKVLNMGWLQRRLDPVARLVLDDAFTELVKKGLVIDSETNRREFINQVGQYNKRLQWMLPRILRETGVAPFITAGKTMRNLAIRNLAMAPGATATSQLAAAKLRLSIVSRWVGTLGSIAMLNVMLAAPDDDRPVWEKAVGPKGAAPGTVMLYTDERGRPVTIDLLELVGYRRAARTVGLDQAIKSYMFGLSPGQTFDRAANQAITSAIVHPISGPPIRAGLAMLYGIDPSGYPVAAKARPGESQVWENLKAALVQSNQATKIIFSEGGSDVSVFEAAAQNLVPRLVPKTGRTERQTDTLAKRLTAFQVNEFADDLASRLKKLPREDRVAALNKALEGMDLMHAAKVRRIVMFKKRVMAAE